MRQADAIQYAERFSERGAYASSRALRSVTPYGKDIRAIGQIAMMMQRYIMSFMGQAVRHTQRGWLSSDAQLAGLGFDQTPGGVEGARSRARQASLMLLGSQFAAAGALGMPFMGAAATLLEKITGEDLKSKAYLAL